MPRARSALHSIATCALYVFVGIVVAEHFLAPGLSPERHMISEYARGDDGPLMVVGFVAWGVSLGVTAFAITHTEFADATGASARILVGLLVIAALGLFITAAVQTQTSAGVLPTGVRRSTSGRLHDLGSGIATLSIFAAGLLSLGVIKSSRGWRRWIASLLILAVGTDAIFLAAGDPVPGLRQRVLVGVGCIWQLMLLSAVDRRGQRRARSAEAQHDPRL